jgi:hypothetical protein
MYLKVSMVKVVEVGSSCRLLVSIVAWQRRDVCMELIVQEV